MILSLQIRESIKSVYTEFLQWIQITKQGLSMIHVTFSNGFLGYEFYVYEMIHRDLSTSFE